ncbi:MerR family transcriptional regulator [Virgibacillus soli]|uniref:MerR family transcriptional regulator n=1 Tax=Paracerasibacillus soli TaxID=480284 RepID=A0ABU5CU08_9BACI|nr:MerR family transcriptional regulator [Virgibacillus soli]MDY0409843.1 MerR family transcriptional regulator [Virgibacillus soli]
MKIGEFAERTGVSIDTIRYYEKIDLLHPEIKNTQRFYGNHDIDIMDIIIKLKQTGFSLQEIKMLFEWSKDTDPNKRLTNEEMQNVLRIKEVFQEKYAQMVQREKNIKQIKQVLRKADNKISQILEANKG